MNNRIGLSILVLFGCFSIFLALSSPASAQQTLGGITGAVTDSSGAALPETTVTAVEDQTSLARTQKTDTSGVYLFVNLPIGTYTLTFTHASFETQRIPSITVQANRTVSVNATLTVGAVSTTVTVEETPLVNAVDTTNGYVLDKVQMEAVPLPTGSFTGLAVLAPGVSAELPSGSGVNTGLGNQPIWANGQRDTSNTFLLNGVDGSNLFNGKSTSSVASARIVNNTGIGGAAGLNSTTAEPLQTTASPYLAIGQALPSPPPETIQEFRTNTSMYDAQQGSTSGAHIDISTASGTNDVHGSAYIHRETNWTNAAPYFYKLNGNIPADNKVPSLHRNVPGGTLGGPLIKNKLFGFIGYQYVWDTDREIGSSRIAVPSLLTNDRSPAGLAAAAEQTTGACPPLASLGIPAMPAPCPYFLSGITPPGSPGVPVSLPATVGTNPGQINPIAYGLLNYKLPNGQFLIPSADGFVPTITYPENTFTLGTAYFSANQVVGNVDFIVNAKDTLAFKMYYQANPTTAPYAYSGVSGFNQHLEAGSQVYSITNTQTLTPTFNLAEAFGFIREKVYSTIAQPFSPQSFSTWLQGFLTRQGIAGVPASATLINTFGSTFFPGISIVDDFGNPDTYSPYNTNAVFNAGTNIGDGANSQGAFTGVFQNRWMPSATAIWIKGRHTLTFGGSYSYTQLNARDERTNKGTIGFTDFNNFLQGVPITYSANGFITTTFLNGNANRYYRNNETGEYVQDKFQLRPNLSISLGVRFDYHGGLYEKNGELYNFDPQRYVYNQDTDTIVNNGFIIAGNNKLFPSKGVSNSTLTGRQWGLAPRIGIAWSPKKFNNKLVVRAGWGLYYDRGELFAYFSPGVAAGQISGGPFGVVQSPPYVNSTLCNSYFYTYCTFQNPFGTTPPVPPTGNPATLNLPNAAAIESGLPLFTFATYNRANKLPYTMNQTLDIQWQPRNDLAIDVGYVGNLGRHEVIPIPFNQARIAAPGNPLCGPAAICPDPQTAAAAQYYTYGYSIVTAPGSFNTIALPPVNGQPVGTYQENFEGGNVDLRVPYIGYSSESESYTAEGVSAYNALQVHVEKRMSHGFQAGFSYTYSHAEDEQSAMGLFYNGNNPLNLRSAYGNSDFDRTHVINFTYHYTLPQFFAPNEWKGRFLDGWGISGLTVIQSGQPYSVIDYSGAVGSIFYGTNDGITNPIVPLTSTCTPQKAETGFSGVVNGKPALDPNCFTLPLLNAGAAVEGLAGAIPSNDPYETNFIERGQRNIFRQPWQNRWDFSLLKTTQITERLTMKFTFDVFNLWNHPSFDIPIDNVSQNINFNGFPYEGQPATGTGGCDTTFTALYVCPSFSGLGVTNKTIGSARQIQMSLSLLF